MAFCSFQPWLKQFELLRKNKKKKRFYGHVIFLKKRAYYQNVVINTIYVHAIWREHYRVNLNEIVYRHSDKVTICWGCASVFLFNLSILHLYANRVCFALLQKVVMQKACLWNGMQRPCYLFARKFYPETLQNMLHLFSNYTVIR